MTKAKYIETVEDEAGNKMVRLVVTIPAEDALLLIAADLTSSFQPDATLSRSVAKPVATALQAVSTDGLLPE